MNEERNNNFSKTILTVKAVIVREGREVLLLKRAKDAKNPSKWDLPGGHLEKGETLEESIKREILEETGLEVEVGEILKTTEFSKDSKHFKDEKRGLRYLAYYQEGEIETSGEHQDFGWFEFDEALEKLSEKDGFEKEKREVILKAKEVLELKDSLNGWRRAVADLENYKRRVVKENQDFKKYCLEDYVFGLLPVLDNFDLALKHVPEDKKNDNWIVGILHIKKQLEDFLENNGVTVIETKKGDEFDENVHEIIEGENKKGKIKEVLKAGYRMGDKVIRPALVKIS